MKFWFFFVVFVFFILVFVQFCEGEFGVVVLFEGFGQGFNFGLLLLFGIISYSYNDGSFQAGIYMVMNCIQFNGVNWYDGLDNILDDGFGYMFFFDVVDILGEFFSFFIDEFCFGIWYEFSVYIINVVMFLVCGGESMEFSICFEFCDLDDDELLESFLIGNLLIILILSWNWFGIVFILLEDQDVFWFSIFNFVFGDCGNDFVIDDISLCICNLVWEQMVILCISIFLIIDGWEFLEFGIYRDILLGVLFCNDSILIIEIIDGIGDEVLLDIFLCFGQAFVVGD